MPDAWAAGRVPGKAVPAGQEEAASVTWAHGCVDARPGREDARRLPALGQGCGATSTSDPPWVGPPGLHGVSWGHGCRSFFLTSIFLFP